MLSLDLVRLPSIKEKSREGALHKTNIGRREVTVALCAETWKVFKKAISYFLLKHALSYSRYAIFSLTKRKFHPYSYFFSYYVLCSGDLTRGVKKDTKKCLITLQ